MDCRLLLVLLLVSGPSVALAADTDPSVSPPPPPAASAPAPVRVRVVLDDGQQLSGELVLETADRVRVRIGDGEPIDLPRTSIRSLERLDRKFRDANVTRHFYAPTGFMLRRGELTLSQLELAFTVASYGVNDHLSFSAGTAVPFWFAPSASGLSPNLLLGLKLGVDASELFHLALGAQAVFLPLRSASAGLPLQVVGLAHGTVTLGTPDLNVTLSGGGLFSSHSFVVSTQTATPVFALGASYRIIPGLVLMTDNWLLPQLTGPYGGVFMINSAGIRVMNERLSASLGLCLLPMAPLFPIPWVDITYTFGP